MPPKPLPSPARAIKNPLKIFIEGVFIVFGLFLTISHISASTIFSDSFESCAVGILNGQCGWSGVGTTSEATTTEFFEGSKSGYFISLGAGNSAKGGTALATGTISVSFFMLPGSTEQLQFDLVPGVASYSARLWLYNGHISYYVKNVGAFIFCNFEFSTWNSFQVEWNTAQLRYACNGGDWTDWKNPAFSPPNNIDRVRIWNNGGTGATKIYFDWFSETAPTCYQGFCELCDNSYDCQVAGCSWHYGILQLWPDVSFCSEIPTGDCGSGFWDCPNCLDQASCEAQSCYWYQNRCSYTGTNCGEGLLTQFCENEADCTGAGGYWYSDFCWLSAPPSNLLDWDDYYDEYGDYATPTAWITGVASSTNGFFGTIGGFLTTFGDNFNLNDAYTKGTTFGNAIPLARSYLGILDEFAGSLPIGEFFIFLLIFTMAIGVFRIVRNLVQLLKFW